MNSVTLSSSIMRPRVVAHAAFIIMFTALAIVVPAVFHQFHLAGPTFLPMHIFVFVAALTLGWRAGFAVGVLSPLVSYGLTRLPVAPILPQITTELAVYGLAAGLLREYGRLNTYTALAIAMVFGRFAAGAAAWLTLPNHPAILSTIRAITVAGWPGVLLQLALVPLVVAFTMRFFASDHPTPPSEVRNVPAT